MCYLNIHNIGIPHIPHILGHADLGHKTYRASDYYLTKLYYRDFKTVTLGNSGARTLASPKTMFCP